MARESSFDELARGLAEEAITRRQALKWAGYGVVGAALSSIGFADTAEALTRRQRRRCRRKGGTPLEGGNCRCSFNCGANIDSFSCQSNPNCACTKTAEGKGFCIDARERCANLQRCSRSCQCPSGRKCVVETCCNPGGGVCARPCP
jgi:hypothetical protein